MMYSPERRENIVRRLNRAQGQVEGLKRMVEDDRQCVDVLMQLSAVQASLRSVGKVIMRNYLETCATNAIRDDAQKGQIYDELMDVIYKYVK